MVRVWCGAGAVCVRCGAGAMWVRCGEGAVAWLVQCGCNGVRCGAGVVQLVGWCGAGAVWCRCSAVQVLVCWLKVYFLKILLFSLTHLGIICVQCGRKNIDTYIFWLSPHGENTQNN